MWLHGAKIPEKYANQGGEKQSNLYLLYPRIKISQQSGFD